jgi:hypothetical protein
VSRAIIKGQVSNELPTYTSPVETDSDGTKTYLRRDTALFNEKHALLQKFITVEEHDDGLLEGIPGQPFRFAASPMAILRSSRLDEGQLQHHVCLHKNSMCTSVSRG